MQSRVVLWAGLMVFLLLPGRAALGASATVTADGAQTYQIIEGFGVNANHRSWDNSNDTNGLKQVLDRLIDEGGMTLFRVIFDKTDWEGTNDNSDPTVMNWSYYDSTEVYRSQDFQKLWDMSAYLNQKGISDGLMLNFQGTGPDWMMTDRMLTRTNEAEWAEMIASLLVYARNTQHLQFTLIGPNNEPDNPSLDQGVNMTMDQYITGLEVLAQLLDANGLNDVRFVGPDLAYTSTDWLSAMMGNDTIMAKLAHFGLHSYQDTGGGSLGIYDFLQRSAYPNRTYWMTEFNAPCVSCNNTAGADSWDYAVGAARYLLWHLYYGASAGLAWEGYDGQYYYYPPPNQWSYWGLFAVDDIGVIPRTYTPRKSFYTLAQISKYVRPGAHQIDITGSFGPFLLAGFYHPDSGQLTLTGINTDTGPGTLSAVLTNLPPVASLDLYYTDATTNLCHSDSFMVTDGAFSGTVPAGCVFTLVGFDPARLAVSVLITNPPDGAQYSAPATIPIQASATTTTGSVSQVEFFCGTTNLGGAAAAPYSLTWNNIPPGTYALSASATNSVGNYGVSPVVHVTVVGPVAQISLAPLGAAVVPYGSQPFTATAADALGTVLVPQPAFSWSASGGGTIDATGLFTAGGSVGGPFTITASNSGVAGTAGISVTTNINLASSGLGYTWYSLPAATDNSPQVAAPGINDGDLGTDVHLLPLNLLPYDEDLAHAYEAAGILWLRPQTINRVVYENGSFTANNNGVFAARFGLQLSADGTTWTNAGPDWTVTPAYAYNSPDSADTSFAFTGGVVTVLGVRCVGQVRTTGIYANSWVAYATEVQTFAAPLLPPPVLAASAASHGIAITWPAPLTRYILETTTNLSPPVAWSPVTNVPQTVGDQLMVTVPAALSCQFFRLHQP